MTIVILGMNNLQYSQNSELPSASNLWEGSIEIPHVHWLVLAFFARYCVNFEISWKRSWCLNVIKCLVHFVTKMFPFYTCRKIWLHCFIKHMTYKSSSKYAVGTSSMRIQNGGQTAPTLATFFSWWEEREDPIIIPSGPSSACQQNTI